MLIGPFSYGDPLTVYAVLATTAVIYVFTVIRPSEETLKLRNSSFPAQNRMDNLMKAHT